MKYEPGQKKEQARLVGSKTASEIEAKWERVYEAQRAEAFRQQIERARSLSDKSQYHSLMAAEAYRKHRDPTDHQRAGFKATIKRAASMKLSVKVLADDKRCCEVCRALDQVVLDADTALERCLFPTDRCSKLGELCMAGVIVHVERTLPEASTAHLSEAQKAVLEKPRRQRECW